MLHKVHNNDSVRHWVWMALWGSKRGCLSVETKLELQRTSSLRRRSLRFDDSTMANVHQSWESVKLRFPFPLSRGRTENADSGAYDQGEEQTVREGREGEEMRGGQADSDGRNVPLPIIRSGPQVHVLAPKRRQ